MSDRGPAPADEAPFHEGERAVQRRAGAGDKLEAIGRRVIRDFLPEQHREFFARLPLFILGWVDGEDRPWASPLVGTPGFLHSPEPRHLHVAAEPLPSDPLRGRLREGDLVGGLGIELHTRRRNRVNGKVALDGDGRGFTIEVEQSFGNCPQYIQARHLRPADPPPSGEPSEVVRAGRLDCPARKIIQCADTLFIASACRAEPKRRAHGVDVSHRGGLRGFVRILDDRTLEFPDYRGNFLFNTLGNLAVDPRCGLLFVGFSRGELLQLTGTAEILWDFPRDDCALEGAERVVRFRVEAMVRAAEVFPLRGELDEYSPELLALCHHRAR